MTDYNSMSHQQLYDYVFSGAPSSVESEAALNQNHAKSVTDATTDLQKTLTKIQASWSGSAADEFTQQANSIVAQMQQHAATADNTYKWMNYASQYLTWAQSNIPSPPSGAEQDLADVNKNSVSEWGLGILTGGTSYLASNAAQEDIAKKKAAAVSVMTQLASAYGTSNDNLTPVNEIIDGGTDTDSGGSSSKNSQNGNGGSSGSSGSSSTAAGMLMPMAMAMQNAGTAGAGSGSTTSNVSTGSGYTSGTGSTSSGTSGAGVTDSKLPTTVTSGLGDLPAGGTTTGTPNGLGTTTGSESSSSGLGGLSGLGPGGLADFGGSSAAGLSAAGEGFGSAGSKTGSALSGGTGTGELGEEAGGTGSGAQSGTEASTAAAAAGEAEGTESTGQNGMMGGMGGMGRGGAGGGQEERGNRASWLKEDPDYWYGDKMKNAAPPGGVIE